MAHGHFFAAWTIMWQDWSGSCIKPSLLHSGATFSLLPRSHLLLRRLFLSCPFSSSHRSSPAFMFVLKYMSCMWACVNACRIKIKKKKKPKSIHPGPSAYVHKSYTPTQTCGWRIFLPLTLLQICVWVTKQKYGRRKSEVVGWSEKHFTSSLMSCLLMLFVSLGENIQTYSCSGICRQLRFRDAEWLWIWCIITCTSSAKLH